MELVPKYLNFPTFSQDLLKSTYSSVGKAVGYGVGEVFNF